MELLVKLSPVWAPLSALTWKFLVELSPVWAPLSALTWKFLVKVCSRASSGNSLTWNFHVKENRGAQTGVGDIQPLFPSRTFLGLSICLGFKLGMVPRGICKGLR